MDGMPNLNLNNFVCDWIAKNNHPYGSVSSIDPPTRLDFSTNEDIDAVIDKAHNDLDRLTDKHLLSVLVYHGLGSKAIKQFKASPDAFVQMAIQLGYYKMHGVCRPTYESAQTRKYTKGRTEVCRTVSVQSAQWCKAMLDPEVPVIYCY